MKKILYFYPHKFASLTDGIHTRIVTFLEYFKSRGILVDMVSFDNPDIEGSYVFENKLVNKIQFAQYTAVEETKPSNFFVTKARSAYRRIFFTNFFMIKAWGLYRRTFPKVPPPTTLPNLVNDSLVSVILEMVSKEKYDAILITYSYWADILKPLIAQGFIGKKVIDPTDFLTLQQSYYYPDLTTGQIGGLFASEIERMKQFDEIIHISYDELLLFSNFIFNIRHSYIPQFFEKKIRDKSLPAKYDILFIGSDNRYNIEGITWFVESVYPLLDKSLRIAVAGKICNHVNIEKENIVKLGFVEDIASLYSASRCTICPLKKGSGIKIKVVESLSFGLPVVSTLKGMDGQPNKMPVGGILVGDEPTQFAAHIKNLLSNPTYYAAQCSHADQMFDEHFSFQSNFSKLDKIFGAETSESASPLYFAHL